MKRCRQLARRSFAAWRPWLGGVLASVVLVSAPGDAADAPAPETENSPETMTFQDDTLAVHVAGVPLEQLMAELSQLSGARVRWLTPRSAEPVTVEFPALPLSEALERLVGNKHFLLLYAPAGVGLRLTQIWISARDINQGTPQPGSKSAGALSLLPVKQPSSPTPGDQRPGQTAPDAQDSRARSGISSQVRNEIQDSPRIEPFASQEAGNDGSSQGQEATAALGLLGGTPSSATDIPKNCVANAADTHFADVTGDGRADALAVNRLGITVRPSDGRQFLFPQAWTAGAYFGTGGTDFADVTGDGRADAIAVKADNLTIRRANITGFLAEESWTTEPYFGVRGTFFADVTGDGRADAIAVTDDGITVRPSDGSRFLNSEIWATKFHSGVRGTFFADVTGDGRADAIAVTDDAITVRRSDGGRFLDIEAWTTEPYSGVHGTFFADVTGDGRADAIAVTDDAITVRPSDGLHFLSPQSWTGGPYFGSGGTFFADVTGDGVADAIAVNADKISVRPSTGEGFASAQSWTITPYFGTLSPICQN